MERGLVGKIIFESGDGSLRSRQNKAVSRNGRFGLLGSVRDVRYGSLADITARSRHVRFTPNNGRWAAKGLGSNRGGTNPILGKFLK